MLILVKLQAEVVTSYYQLQLYFKKQYNWTLLDISNYNWILCLNISNFLCPVACVVFLLFLLLLLFFEFFL